MTVVLTKTISHVVPEGDQPRIQSAIKDLEALFKPHLIDLNPEQRRALPKMGDRTIAFVSRAYQFACQHPEFKPPFVDLEEFAIDLAAVDSLAKLLAPLSQLVDMVDDTMMLSGSEALAAALAYFQAVKTAARQGLPGARQIADELGVQFAGRNGKEPVTPAPVPAPVGAPPPAASV
jgi:hypothetical protein